MRIEQIIKKLNDKQTVLVKNMQMSDLLADLIIYYIEEEPNHIFSKLYKEKVGENFEYKTSLQLFIKNVYNIDCDYKFDKLYTKIIPK